MKTKNIRPILLVVGLLLAPLSVAWAGELPPPNSKQLSEVLDSVEQQKMGVITEAEFDDGMWEVKVCDAGVCQKLYITPKSGEEKRRRTTNSYEMPPVNAMPLATIIKSVEARGLGPITEVEFDDGFWEVKMYKEGRKSRLFIDPYTGKTRR